MEPHCIPFSEIPHTTPLFADYLYGFSRLERFFAHDPFRAESFEKASRALVLEEARRTAVADVLAEQNEIFAGDARTQENIRRLREGRARAVVTGQQVGLFGGPAYSVYKALTAIRLAEKLTAEGLPAVPVYWLASEDHDFAEVNHCEFLDGQQQLLALADSSAPPADTPIGEITFAAAIDALRQEVKRLWPADRAAEAESLLSGYRPGASYAHAFGRLMQRLFAGRGLVVLDPQHPTLHTLARSLFRHALEEAEALHTQVRGRDRELEQAHYHVQVRLRENATLLFLTLNGRRLPMRRRGSGFSLPGEGERSLAELLELLEREPERFSPNVLLRPLVQDSLLPTVAYVAGPNEIAYFAQASVLYDKLLGRMPVIVPRVSLTLAEPKIQRLLERYQLGLKDFFHGREPVRARLAERHLPPRLLRRLERAQAQIEKLLSEAAGELKRLDPSLEGAADTSRRKMLYQLEKLRHKAARAQAERTEIIGRHLDMLSNSLCPHRELQERRLNFLSFVARHGQELVDRLFEQVSFPC
ncbi:MAG: bacillithiol biosynthesis cysteine-adding enzyme BshC, partial [Candidatus Acidiferrales bacterium]